MLSWEEMRVRDVECHQLCLIFMEKNLLRKISVDGDYVPVEGEEIKTINMQITGSIGNE